MRVFQNSGLYRTYVPRLRELAAGATTFSDLIGVFLNDRFCAVHLLAPVLQREEFAFFANGDDEISQRAWAREHGLPGKVSLVDILLAQIEAHRADVFYNLDPMLYGSDFVRKLPGCVKCSIAWRAAPSGGADFSCYDLMVCNFPSILRGFASNGWKTAYFSPAHDPVMDEYAANADRPIDVLFVGGYSRHHLRRARLLESVAQLSDRLRVVMHLAESLGTRFAESIIGRLAPLGRYRRPISIRQLSKPPVFGRDLYLAHGRSKIVINGAIDMAGKERGNMRCWEAMGLGCLMVSDSGIYPAGMIEGESFLSYSSECDVPGIILRAIGQWENYRRIALAGHEVVSARYSKANQMRDFERLVGAAV